MFTIIGILALSVLVFVHELGHFLAAKYFKVGVLEFAIGFGKKLFSFNIKETTYSLRLIPLGGLSAWLAMIQAKLIQKIALVKLKLLAREH